LGLEAVLWVFLGVILWRSGWDMMVWKFCLEIILDLGGLLDCHLEDMIPLSLQFLCTMPFHGFGRLIYTMKELIYILQRAKSSF
jgi:hypothetical protein